MDEPFSLEEFDRPTVFLFSEPEGLAISILENLLANYCRVNVFTDNISDWKSLSSHLKENINYSINSYDQLNIKENINYLLYESTLFSKVDSKNKKLIFEKEKEKLSKALEIIKEKEARGLFLFPNKCLRNDHKTLKELIEKLLINIPTNVEVIYLDPPIGPRMLLTKRFLISRYLRGKILDEVIDKPSTNEILNPIYIADAARNIVKNLFSFSFPGKDMVLLGKEVSLSGAEVLMEINNNLLLKTEEEWIENDGNVRETIISDKSLKEAIKLATDWFAKSKPSFLIEEYVKNEYQETLEIEQNRNQQYPEKILILKKEPNKNIEKKNKISLNNKGKKERKLGKLVTRVPITLFLALVLPVILLIISTFGVYLGQTFLLKGNLSFAKNIFLISSASSKASTYLFSLYSHIPVTDKIFSSGKDDALFINNDLQVLVKLADVYERSGEMLNKVMGDSPYDIVYFSKDLSLDLDSLYREISFLEGEYKELNSLGAVYIKRITKNIDLTGKRDIVVKIKLLVDLLPNLLGQDTPKTYLILLQNNFQLRPTGGFIETIALLKFNKGRVVDTNIMNVYSVDEQLKGKVEPPEEIKNYLGQENWYLRDSNWDPDFPSSAQRAEWFLEKEIGESVDGVVAIDLKFIKDLLKITGKLNVQGFNQALDENNFYEMIQTQANKDSASNNVGNNYYPGLMQEVFNKITSFDKQNNLIFNAILYQELSDRHIQVFLHDNKGQKTVSDLGWDGSINYPLCVINNCYSDWLSVIETNVGANNANYFIESEGKLTNKIKEKQIVRTMTLSLKNNANPALGYKGKYRTYIRIYVPEGSVFAKVNDQGVGDMKSTYPLVKNIEGYIEAGFFTEILPGQYKEITFEWSGNHNLNFSQNGEYLFYWRKQAGQDVLNADVVLEFPQGINFEAIDRFSLTRANVIEYNTTSSSRDIVSRISFRKY